MKKLIFFAALALSCSPLFAQFTISAGYTSASARFHDVEYFGDSIYMKNGGVGADVEQKQRGFNVGLGVQGLKGGGPYMRLGMNFSKHGQKSMTLADGSTMRLRSTATDLYVAAGGMFGGGAGGAVYALLGATYTTGRLDLGGNWSGLEGKYKGNQIKFSYGLGVGLFSESGFGLSLDFYCNFSDKDSKNFMENGDKKLPRDYATYLVNPTGYTGEYVRSTNGYIRGQVTLHIPLGGK